MPLLSIVTNARNGSKFLPGLFDTIDKQTHTNWEHIFFDNNSTDNTREICESRESKISYFKSDKDLPLSEARNLALEKCSGKYIAILDCDDLWEPNKIEYQINILEENKNFDICTTDYSTLVQNEMIKASPAKTKDINFQYMLVNYLICHSSVVFRTTMLRSINEYYDPNLHVAHDKEFILRLLINHKIYHINSYLSIWRHTNQSLTNSRFDLLAKDNEYIIDKFEKLVLNFEKLYSKQIKLLNYKINFHYAIFYWKENEANKSRLHLKKRIWHPKFFTFYIVTLLISSSAYNLVSKLYIKLKGK
tara:strand:+ start:7518 stop:8432 length:915 start_codon:yes stop_codon:yes gene_type:complete